MTLLNSDFQSARDWEDKPFLHPWKGKSYLGQNERTFTESGLGIHVVTEDGKQLIDGPAGMWCLQSGYGNTEIADAMAQQTNEMAYFHPSTMPTRPRPGWHMRLPREPRVT